MDSQSDQEYSDNEKGHDREVKLATFEAASATSMLDDLRRKWVGVICQDSVSGDTSSCVHIVGTDELSTSIANGRRFNAAAMKTSPNVELISVGQCCVDRGRWRASSGKPPFFVKP
eukprot:2450962-Heterocapsa_arctica.AAC.1